MRLHGWTAVVTGASSGIGAAAARAFAREGAHVALGARSEKTLDALAGEIRRAGGRAEALPLDVRDEASVRAFAAETRARLGSVDLLLNNAGVGGRARLVDTATEDFDDVVGTNLRGAFLVLREILPLMLDGPRVRTAISVASVSGTMGQAGLSAYCASKWGLRGLVQSVALEVADRGVRALTVNPGYVATPMVDGARVPAADMIQPDELASALVDLATLPGSVQIDDVTLWPRRLYST